MTQYKLNLIAFLLSLSGLEFLIMGFGSVSIAFIVLNLTLFFLLVRYRVIIPNYINFILACIVLTMISTGIYNSLYRKFFNTLTF